jgi:hypothetical protein
VFFCRWLRQPLPPFSDVVERDVTLHRFYFQEVIWTVGFK